MSKKISFISQSVATTAFALSFLVGFGAQAAGNVTVNGGDLIKLPDDGNMATSVDEAVYYFGLNGLRYVFPNSKTYFTWYSNFNGIKVVSAAQMGTIGIGGNVTYKPGVKMIKIESDPKVYAVDRNGLRRWVSTEAVAIALYGSTWNKQIDDVSDAFFSNYAEGEAIANADDFAAEGLKSTITDISIDKNLISPKEVSINANGTFSPSAVAVLANDTVRFTNNTSGDFRLKSNDLPGFDSAYIPAGLNYVYKFKTVGTWTYFNNASISITGTVTVQ